MRKAEGGEQKAETLPLHAESKFSTNGNCPLEAGASMAPRLSTVFVACLLSAFAIGSDALAITEDSPYHGIVARNIFDVHPAPPPKIPGPEDNRPPPPNIKLQGITDILGKKQVIMKVQLPGKPGTPAAKDEAFILTVGQRQGEIEVLDIDVKAGTVLVNNYGVKTNLSLEANSDKLVSTGPVPGAPPPIPNIGSPPPSAIPPPPNPAAGRFPPRTLRLPGQPQASTASPTANPTYVNGAGYPSAVGNQQQELTHDQQVLSLAGQYQISKNSNDPRTRAMAPIIPLPQEVRNELDGGGNPTLPPSPPAPPY